MTKTVYVIPGYTESTKLIGYKKAMQFFSCQGIKPVPITITWKYRTMSDYVKQFLQQYHSPHGKDVYLFGFSFGAMIALIAAATIKPKLLLLCSLSPYFKEDLPFLKKHWKKSIGTRRIRDLKQHPFNRLAKKISCNVILVAGSKESKQIWRRARDANKKLRKSKLITASGAKHKLSQKEYLDTVRQIISKLS